MEIHLYCISFNEEYMLPYFFRHYDAIVDRYVIYDDGSTDRTLEMLENHPAVEVKSFSRSFKESYVLSEQAHHNNAWKESRGKCDWVITTDIDEHIWHPSILEYLSRLEAENVTLVPGLGFQMISEQFPTTNGRLCDFLTTGAQFQNMSKLSIFNPNVIEETNFAVGRHTAKPSGKVAYPVIDELLILHYKYMGLDYLRKRNAQLQTGHGSLDISQGWGHRQRFNDEDLVHDFESFKARSFNVMDSEYVPDRDYIKARWWKK